MALSVLFTWLHNNTSGSVWTAVFFHWICTCSAGPVGEHGLGRIVGKRADVLGEELSRLGGQWHDLGLAALSGQGGAGGFAEVDVPDRQVTGLLDPGAGVVERCHQRQVAQPATCGALQQQLDRFDGQVADSRLGDLSGLDAQDLPGLCDLLGSLGLDVAEEPFQRGQALVGGRGGALPVGATANRGRRSRSSL